MFGLQWGAIENVGLFLIFKYITPPLVISDGSLNGEPFDIDIELYTSSYLTISKYSNLGVGFC